MYSHVLFSGGSLMVMLLAGVQAKVGDAAYASVLYIRQADENLQAFNQSLADAAAPPIVPSGQTDRPFMVNGNTFTKFSDAATRTCDIQYDGCQKTANAQGNKGAITVNDCNTQRDQCKAFQKTAPKQNFDTTSAAVTPPTQDIFQDPDDPDFDLVCDP